MNRPTRRELRPLLVGVALAAITFAVFSPALTHEFLTYDDQQYVTENPHVQSGLSWAGVTWAFRSFYASNWHPLTWLSHMLDWQLYGGRAGGHHLTNVLLHVANTVLLFLVLRRMTGVTWRSACVAALFGWHPLHVQSVAWIAERKDVLCALFWLLTLLLYARYAEAGRQGRENKPPGAEPSSRFTFHLSRCYLATLLCFALALMIKPMAVTLPLVLLLLDYWPLRRWTSGPPLRQGAWFIYEKFPFFALAAVGCVLTLVAQGRSYSLVSTGGLPLGRRLGHALISYVHYVWATFVPRHLAAYYPYPEHESATEIAGAALLLAIVTVLVWRARVLKPYLLVGWGWFLVTLVPVIGLVQVGDQAWADRYTYLPLVGLFLMLVWGIADLAARSGARFTNIKAATLGAVCAVTGLALLAGTWLELRWWKDTQTLFTRALEVTHRNVRAMVMVGSFRSQDGKLDEAMSLYRQALSIRPDDPEAHFFLARAYENQGKLEAAADEYSQALWFKPLQERTHIFLGVLRARQGLAEQAAAHYRAALAINPESASAENDLARLLHSQGKLDEAITHYSRALRFDPNLAPAHNNLGVLLLQQGHIDEAVAQLRSAAKLNPNDPETQFNLASALNQLQQWPAAAGLLRQLVPARPEDANCHYQLALALAHLGQTKDALSEYAKALLIRADFPEALDGLSWVLATDPRPDIRNGEQALQMSSHACALTSRKQPAMLLTLAAAYAENGRFEDASKTAEESKALTPNTTLVDKCEAMITAFKAAKPWREEPARQ